MTNNPSESKAPSLSHQTVLDLLKNRAGLIFPETRMTEVYRVVDKAAAAAQFTVPQYAYNLAIDSASFDSLCNDVTISESYFFRDPKQFDFVKNRVIPEWRQALHPQGPLQVWSAGCSTGEEAYSLAILFEQEGLSNLFKLTATDICRKSLAAAADAKYNPWALRTADQRFCSMHFDQVDNHYHLKERYKNTVRFAHLNLVSDLSNFKDLNLANLDLIFCRNVLIYFDPTAIAKTIQTFHSLLKPGGSLILGPSDPAASQFADFDVIVCEYGVFYKKLDGPPGAPVFRTAARALSDLNERNERFSTQQQKDPTVKKSHLSDDIAHQQNLARKHAELADRLTSSQTNFASVKKLADVEVLEQAQLAYDHGLYEKGYLLTGHALDNEKVAILHIKALANFKGSAAAEKILAKLIQQHTNSFHLQYLHGHLLLDLNQLDLALAALKRCLYLDPRTAMAHFSLALVQKGLGDRAGAQRSFRNVIDLCKNLPPDELLPYGDGERVKILTVAASAELTALSGK